MGNSISMAVFTQYHGSIRVGCQRDKMIDHTENMEFHEKNLSIDLHKGVFKILQIFLEHVPRQGPDLVLGDLGVAGEILSCSWNLI